MRLACFFLKLFESRVQVEYLSRNLLELGGGTFACSR
jgi:hypothetical protein